MNSSFQHIYDKFEHLCPDCISSLSDHGYDDDYVYSWAHFPTESLKHEDQGGHVNHQWIIEWILRLSLFVHKIFIPVHPCVDPCYKTFAKRFFLINDTCKNQFANKQWYILALNIDNGYLRWTGTTLKIRYLVGLHHWLNVQRVVNNETNLTSSGPFYYHGLTLITAWISNYIRYKI